MQMHFFFFLKKGEDTHIPLKLRTARCQFAKVLHKEMKLKKIKREKKNEKLNYRKPFFFFF